MSALQQKLIPATIEVFYSDARKNDMRIEEQDTCSLIINIIKHVFKDRGIKLQEILVPKSRPRDADIYFEVLLDESEIESIKKEIMEKTVGGLKFVEVFVDI